MRRDRKLTPWYHQARPRCDAITGRDERCSFSGSYGNGRVNLCKMHRDMLDDRDGVFRKLRTGYIELGSDAPATGRLRSVS